MAAFLDCCNDDEPDDGADDDDADDDDVNDDAGWSRSVATDDAEMGAAFLPPPMPLSGDLESRMRVP